jgi:hypothetical protein
MGGKYTLEQQILVYDGYVKMKSDKSCKKFFIIKYAGVHVPTSVVVLLGRENFHSNYLCIIAILHFG